MGRKIENTTDICTYKKLAVQWLNEVLYFVKSSVMTDILVLRDHQLLVATKRQPCEKNYTINLIYLKPILEIL